MSPFTVKKKTSIDEEVLVAGRRLRRAQNTPGIDEQQAYLAASQKNDVHILLAQSQGAAVGLSVCFRSKDRAHGLSLQTYRTLGYQLYDDNELLYAPGYESHCSTR